MERSASGIIVAGCHRSGTSALAGALSQFGWRLPGNLVAAGRGNDLGHFEPRLMVQANDAALEALGRSWLDPKPLPQGWLTDQRVAKALGDLPAVLHQDFPEQPYLIKDPRLSLLLPLWLEPLGAFRPAPLVVIACRNPYEVAKSLRRRNGLAVPHGLALWQSYMLEAERNTRGLARMIVHYDELLSNAEAVLQRIHDRAGLAGQTSREAIATAARGISRGERHAKISDDDFLGNENVAADIRAIYRIFIEADGSFETGAFDQARALWLAKWQRESPGPGPSAFALQRPETHLMMSRAALVENRFDEGLDAARRAAELAPLDVTFQIHLGKLLLKSGAARDAAEAFRNVLRLAPETAGVGQLLAAALKATGEYADAAAILAREVEARPGDVSLTEQLSQLLCDTGEFDRAIALIATSAGLNGMSAQHCIMLSRTYRRSGRRDVAIGFARQALASGNPQDAAAAAVQLAKCGARQEAEDILRGLTSSGVEAPEAQAALDQIAARGG